MSSFPPTSPDHTVNHAPPTTFAVGAAFSGGGRAFGANYGPLLAAAAIWFGLYVASGAIGLIVPGLNLVASVTVMWPLAPGMLYMGIRAYRDETVTIDDLWIGFRCYGRSLLLMLLITLISMACMAPVFIAGILVVILATANLATPITVSMTFGLGMILSILGLLYVIVRLSLSYGLIVDPLAGKPTATDAMSRSWTLTRDLAWPLIGLYLVLGLVAIGSLLLVCVGYVMLGMPFGMAVAGAAYVMITGVAAGRTCLHCGYDLTGNTGPNCPECGIEVPHHGNACAFCGGELSGTTGVLCPHCGAGIQPAG